MILDTQFLGALADGNEGAREKAAELDRKPIPTRIPTAVMWEVYTGAANAPHSGDQLHALYQNSWLADRRSTLRPTSRDGLGS